MGAVAQLERSLVRQRQREGIALAEARGVYRGRGRRLDEAAVAEARRLAGTGVPTAKIARDLGCSRRVLYDAITGTGACAAPGATTPHEAPG